MTYNIRASSPQAINKRHLFVPIKIHIYDWLDTKRLKGKMKTAIYSGIGRIWNWFQGKLKGLVRDPSVPSTMLGILYRLFSKPACGVAIPAPSSLNNFRKMSSVGLEGPKKKKKTIFQSLRRVLILGF